MTCLIKAIDGLLEGCDVFDSLDVKCNENLFLSRFSHLRSFLSSFVFE